MLLSTAVALGVIGSTTGSITLAQLSGVQTDGVSAAFPSHPYVQIYGFIAEFVVGVAYSLLPRFKAGHLPRVSLGYLIYGCFTLANVIFILSPMLPAFSGLGIPASLLLIAGSATFAYQVVELVRRPAGIFPETNPLIILSAVSLALISILLLLEVEGLVSRGETFPPQLILLSLAGFAGSMIYAVEIRSVSFRQCDYRKDWANSASVLQASGIVVVFVDSIAPNQALSVLGGLLFVAGAFCVLISIKIVELAHPLMYRPAMTPVHFRIMRHNEVCILSGSIWLLLGLGMGVVWLGNYANAFVVRDMSIHSIAIGFIGSTITCFAPMLLPGLLGRRGPITGLSYGPIGLLDAGLIVRLVGDLQASSPSNLPGWEAASGPLILAAMAWFLLMLRGAGKRGLRQTSPKTATKSPDLHDLRTTAEGQLAVTGRTTGKERTIPVWFVLKDGSVLLIPARGKKTQWYRNVMKNPKIRFAVGNRVFEAPVQPILENGEIRSVVALFRDKYGDRNFRNYYGDKVNVVVRLSIPKESVS